MLTFTISGSTQVEGVTLKGLPNNPKSGANGAYSVTVPFNWTGTIKPEKDGYTFEPVEIPYSEIWGFMGSGIHCSSAAIWRE